MAVKTRKMVMTAGFTAIILLMAMIPFLGYIPLGFMNATIIHVPVIVGAIVLGPKSGAFLGAVFGFTSIWNATIRPLPTSFVFSPFTNASVNGPSFMNIAGSTIIALIPRILIGIVAYYVYHMLLKLWNGRRNNKKTALILSGVAGSLTNTFLVMNLIYLFFGSQYAQAAGKAFQGLYLIITGVIFINGIPEAFIAGFLTLAVARVLLKTEV